MTASIGIQCLRFFFFPFQARALHGLSFTIAFALIAITWAILILFHPSCNATPNKQKIAAIVRTSHGDLHHTPYTIVSLPHSRGWRLPAQKKNPIYFQLTPGTCRRSAPLACLACREQWPPTQLACVTPPALICSWLMALEGAPASAHR